MSNCLICKNYVDILNNLRLVKDYGEDNEKYIEYLKNRSTHIKILEEIEFLSDIKIIKVLYTKIRTLGKKKKTFSHRKFYLKLDNHNKNIEIICNKDCITRHLRKCKECGKSLTHTKSNQIRYGYCSRECFFKGDPDLFYKKTNRPDAKYLIKIDFNREGLLYLPEREAEVVHLFSKTHEKIGFPFIKYLREDFPDCMAIDSRGKEVKIEFEYKSSNFVIHKHNVLLCDLIICWEHDWKESPIKVFSFKEYFKISNVNNN